MPRFLVSYDLITPGQEYPRLVEELKRLGGKKVLASQWAVHVDKTAVELRDHIWGFMDANDRLLISDLESNWAGMRLKGKINDV